MADIKLAGNPCKTIGTIPSKGQAAPDFHLVKADMSMISLKDLKGKNVIMNIYPSIDTDVCATSTRTFNKRATDLDETVVICISKDLPFAQKRFCGAEGLENVLTASDFVDGSFGRDYGLTIDGGRLNGLHSRVIIVLDKEGVVTHSEQVPEIVQEPDYESAISALA